MLPLFEMMLRAQNGAAMDALAKQFNLAQEQAAQAMAALLPAFSSGFKRTSSNPYDLTSLMSAVYSGAYGKYFEDVSKAFTPQGIADGNAVIEKLFGSSEVTKAVAEQAAQITGIGQDILRQMMPAVADTIMGGLFKQMTGQMKDSPFSADGMEKMQRQWLEAIGFAPRKPSPQPDPFDNPMFQAMRSMWGLEKPKAPEPAANPFLDNPFTKAFQEMMAKSMAAMTSAAAPEAKPAPQAKPEEAKGEAAPKPDLSQFQSVLNSMFDSGVEAQKAYQKNMEAIFESYLKTTSPQPSP